MRFVTLAPVNDQIADMEQFYGKFDLGLDGTPNQNWCNRNLKRFSPPEMLQCAFFPDMYVNKVLVNRRILGPLNLVYAEIVVRWSTEARKVYGLNQYVKCYNFGDGDGPNLFWYGAAWRLSQEVGGEILTEVSKIFTRNGFTHVGTTDKKRVRDFEMW